MKKTLLAALLGLGFVAGVSAQTSLLEGSWHGEIKVSPSVALQLVVNLDKQSDGQTAVTLDSPQQGAYGIPGELNFLSADSLNFSVIAIGASFAGRRSDGRIEGIFRQGAMSLPLTLSPGKEELKRPQIPKPPFPYSSREVSVTNASDTVTLAGTLTLPENFTSDTPVVVLVTGSGLQNRDEELMGHKPFAVIADRLARNGIATLRYDDRGYGSSTGNGMNATTRDFSRDAAAVVDFLRSSEGFSRVGVLGHSEGASIAFILAAGSSAPDFIIAMAPPAVSGAALLIDQNYCTLKAAGMPEPMVAQYTGALAKLFDAYISGKKPDMDAITDGWSTDAAAIPLKNNLFEVDSALTDSPWLREFLAYSPDADITASCGKTPAFVLFGGNDKQVRPEVNEPKMRAMRPDAEIKLYPGLNHLMQHSQSGFPQEYAQIEETISEDVLADIIAFILSDR